MIAEVARPRSLTAVNITWSQLEAGRGRLRDAGARAVCADALPAPVRRQLVRRRDQRGGGVPFLLSRTILPRGVPCPSTRRRAHDVRRADAASSWGRPGGGRGGRDAARVGSPLGRSGLAGPDRRHGRDRRVRRVESELVGEPRDRARAPLRPRPPAMRAARAREDPSPWPPARCSIRPTCSGSGGCWTISCSGLASPPESPQLATERLQRELSEREDAVVERLEVERVALPSLPRGAAPPRSRSSRPCRRAPAPATRCSGRPRPPTRLEGSRPRPSFSIASSRVHPNAWIPVSVISRAARCAWAASIPSRSQSSR